MECGKTFGGFEYKEHNECMTEVQKYQGKFIERQREMKQQEKQKSRDKKVEKATTETKEPEKKVEKKTLRKYLGEDGETFQGWAKTAQALLKDRDHQMKESKFLKKIIKVYKLSSKFQEMSEEEIAKHTDE